MLENAEKNAPGLLGEVALAGRFDNILYSWQCFGAEEEKKRREVKSLSWRKGLQTSQQPLSS